LQLFLQSKANMQLSEHNVGDYIYVAIYFRKQHPCAPWKEFTGIEQFKIACEHGYLNYAKCVLHDNPGLDMSANHNYAFHLASYNGHLKVVKWLLEMSIILNQDLDISSENEYALRWACYHGHLPVVKWLLRIKPDVDVLVPDMLIICGNGHVEVAKLLFTTAIKQEKKIVADWNQIYRWVTKINKDEKMVGFLETIIL